MDTPEHQRAARACKTCRDRKKGCDKSLPECTYCKARNLGCQYDSAVAADGRPSGPVKWQPWSPSKTRRGHTQSVADQEACPAPATMVSEDVAPAVEDMDLLRDFLWTQVQRVVASLGLSYDEIADRFFDGIHIWLPILSPRHFRQTVRSFGASTPPPDVSALLLAMCLITFRPQIQSSHPLRTGTTSLYMTVRSVFMQAQAMVCASTPIIQASVLLAAYEYATGRIEEAYVQIGLASRMCHVLGIDQTPEPKTVQNDRGSLEDLNVWWGVIILERQILLEATDRARYPMTKHPKDNCYAPVQLDIDQSKDTLSTCRIAPILPTTLTTTVGGFGRQAQAVYLLDRTFTILNHDEDKDCSVSALKLLDGELQHLLKLTMGEYRGPGSHCGANATTLRTLYLLHQSILIRSNPGTVAASDPGAAVDQAAISEAALDTVVRMIAEVATDHVKRITNIDRLPVCAAYNFQLCIKHMEAREASLDDDLLAAVSDLKILGSAFQQRWQWRGPGPISMPVSA